MNVWDIIFICLMTAVVSWFVVFSVITLVRAKKAGIIRVKFPANTAPFVCMAICAALNITAAVGRSVELPELKKEMDDLQRLGFVDFHMEYYHLIVTSTTPEDEQYATEKLLSEYREKYDRKRHMVIIQALAAISCSAAALFNGAYITKKGVFMFGDIKPRNTAAKVEDAMLCFQSKGKHEYTMLKLPATEENLRLYSEFMTEEKIKTQ